MPRRFTARPETSGAAASPMAVAVVRFRNVRRSIDRVIDVSSWSLAGAPAAPQIGGQASILCGQGASTPSLGCAFHFIRSIVVAPHQRYS